MTDATDTMQATMLEDEVDIFDAGAPLPDWHSVHVAVDEWSEWRNTRLSHVETVDAVKSELLHVMRVNIEQQESITRLAEKSQALAAANKAFRAERAALRAEVASLRADAAL